MSRVFAIFVGVLFDLVLLVICCILSVVFLLSDFSIFSRR